ncbi:hypothetical protein ACTMTI_30515 [Nonomuraea sp. H19]|uniref:hypothetical protein n=1 Tax=Nonomuraea sp. H19 TaxID=3452206 RepID=UPI003F8AFF12
MMPSDQESQGFGRFPGRQVPLRVGFLLSALVDQLGEGWPVRLGEVLQKGDAATLTGLMSW